MTKSHFTLYQLMALRKGLYSSNGENVFPSHIVGCYLLYRRFCICLWQGIWGTYCTELNATTQFNYSVLCIQFFFLNCVYSTWTVNVYLLGQIFNWHFWSCNQTVTFGIVVDYSLNSRICGVMWITWPRRSRIKCWSINIRSGKSWCVF